MSIWDDRDEPVLRYLLENPPRHRILMTNSMSDQPDERLPKLSEAEFERAIETLTDAGYVAFRDLQHESGGGRYRIGFFVTGKGKQVVGAWPSFDVLGQPGELAAVLERLAELAPTAEEASNLRRAAKAIRKHGPAYVGALLKGALGAAVRGALA